ncbi:MAG: nucleotidyltransferase domain-containing protein [Candidatus Nanohaloarchaea archaeon]
MDPDKILEETFEIIDRAGFEKRKVSFIYLFGSVAEAEETELSDIDIAISLENVGDKVDAEIKLKSAAPDKYDVSIFENLPLQVKKQVLGGKLLYAKDRTVYDKAFETLEKYDFYEPLYRKAVGAE